jgi:hypothetical protein
LVSSKNCFRPANLKSNQHLLPHVAAMPKAVTVIVVVVIVDAIVVVAANAASAVNGTSGQQTLPPIPPQTQRAHVKQNPVKKAAVAIAMVAPSALKSHAQMEMPQAQRQAILHLQPIAIQRQMEVISARVVVAIDVVVAVDNALSVAKVAQKRMQRLSLATQQVAHGPHRVWLDHRQPFLPAN